VTTIAHALREHRWALIENRENDGWPVVFVYDRRYGGLLLYSDLPMFVMPLDLIERGTDVCDDEDPEFNAKIWKEERAWGEKMENKRSNNK
jgi:hypothetical protein